MKNDIADKLNKHIAKGVSTEADVVYIMVEVRKLLEHSKSQAKNYRVLEFYSN